MLSQVIGDNKLLNSVVFLLFEVSRLPCFPSSPCPQAKQKIQSAVDFKDDPFSQNEQAARRNCGLKKNWVAVGSFGGFTYRMDLLWVIRLDNPSITPHLSNFINFPVGLRLERLVIGKVIIFCLYYRTPNLNVEAESHIDHFNYKISYRRITSREKISRRWYQGKKKKRWKGVQELEMETTSTKLDSLKYKYKLNSTNNIKYTTKLWALFYISL